MCSIVLAAIETVINKDLDVIFQGLEEGSDGESRGNNDEGIVLADDALQEEL